jgi:hypothetical protein
MMDWQPMRDAPIGEPVTVWCNILGGPPGDEREWTAIQKFQGWWTLHGKRGRIQSYLLEAAAATRNAITNCHPRIRSPHYPVSNTRIPETPNDGGGVRYFGDRRGGFCYGE